MKFNREEFRGFVLAEARKVAINEGWIEEDNNEIDYEQVDSTSEKIIEDAKDQTKEAKQLSEELSRMKQLLDFRNPVLGEKK